MFIEINFITKTVSTIIYFTLTVSQTLTKTKYITI